MMIDLEEITCETQPKNGSYFTIAIDGRGGSGKSALAEFLGRKLEGFLVINGDDYFEPNEHHITWGDFNEERFRDDVLSPISSGSSSLTIRPYDFPLGVLGPPEQLTVFQGVIVERCYSFTFPVDWDMAIWVETPPEICLQRGLKRDGAEVFGERAEAAWKQVWQPQETSYIAQTAPRQTADFVVDGTQPFARQFRQ